MKVMPKAKVPLAVLTLATALLSQTETTLLSTTTIGAVNAGLAGMAVDQAGNRYLAIALQNVRDAPGTQVLSGTGDATRGIAVRKIAIDGTIAYSAWLPGITDIGVPQIAVNATGEVYLAGVTYSQFVMPTPGAVSQPVTGRRGFVLKLSAGGDRVLIAAILDFTGVNGGVARIALDAAQNISVAVTAAYLQATPGTFTPAAASDPLAEGDFVVRLNPTASEVLVVSRVTEINEKLSDLALDSDGNFYVAGLSFAGLGEPGRTAQPYLRDLVSRDGGNTWTVAGEWARADLAGRNGRITVHPINANTVFQTGQGGIFRSMDGGVNWSRLGADLESYSIQKLFIHPTAPNLMFVLTAAAIDSPSMTFRSEDSGVTWSPVSSEPQVTRVVFDPLDPSYVFLDNTFALIRSTDGGRTFQRIVPKFDSPAGRTEQSIWNLTITRTSPPLMYGYNRFGLARSEDHGENWLILYFGCGVCPVLTVFTVGDGSPIYGAAGGGAGGLVTSADGGLTWKLTSNQAGFDSASVRRSESNPSVFFANIQGRVMRTADAGITWTPVTGLVERTLPFSFEVAPGDGTIAYATLLRGSDVFVRKLDANARQTLFSGVAGGFGGETVARIQIDRTGRIYIGGTTNSIDFPTDSPIPDNDTYDAFVIAFDPAHTDPAYSRRIGGAGRTIAADMAVDCSGNAALALTTTTRDLPSGAGALQAGIAGGSDVFLLQLDPGGALSYTSYFGGENDDAAAAIAVDSDGRIHLAGFTASSSLPGLSRLQAGQNIFISTLRTSLAPCR